MDESERIFQELETLEATRDGIEKRWSLMNNSSELRTLVEDLNFREKTGPQEEIERLRRELEVKLMERDREKDTDLVKWKGLKKELNLLVRPAIEKGVERLGMEFRPLKLEKKITSRTSGGFNMTSRVTLETNEDGVARAQKIIREAIETLRTMVDKPISQIELFVQEKLKEIQAVDLSVQKKEVDELKNERKDFITSPVRL
jgi:hypothetical protein